MREAFERRRNARLACLPLRSIKSLELKNFMTHSHLILRPSARGNLIIGEQLLQVRQAWCARLAPAHWRALSGPNGSGKSSVVCAIILGLGGSIRTMDRATDLSGFVKRDTQVATITVRRARLRRGARASTPPLPRAV